MSKQTNKSGSKFGGDWTKQKLLVIDEYLKKYSMVLKNTKVRKVYVDAFAGSGKTELKEQKKNTTSDQVSLFETHPNTKSSIIDGSALLSLKYDFDEYYFLELDVDRIKILEDLIKQDYNQKLSKVHFINGDSNKELLQLIENIKNTDRCLMFLDPYALELNWSTLECISKKGVIDLWYLFPLNALTRVIPKDISKLNANEKLVSNILGTNDWKDTLYEPTGRKNFFGEEEIQRVAFDKLIEFVVARFKKIFPYVSDKHAILKNAKNSPLFLLSFMMTNSSSNATNLAEKLVKGIVDKLEKTHGKN